ncbi:MAG: methyltransferase domain-containing protein [Thiovulaceae bacterium]|nr:methyltransferase domain-containing protein [Sulfurimonadaceae bacterium]
MILLIVTAVTVLALIAIGCWWRYRSLACPASFSWLLENPYMNAVAGPDMILQRLHLEEGMKLLDVGSGPGRLALPAAKRVGSRGEVVALDIQPEMLERLGRRAEAMGIGTIRLLNAGAGSGKTDREHFDRALLVTVLGEISKKHEALAEIYNALKEGGILSVTEVIPDPHYTSKKRVRALCREVGFEEIASFGNRAVFTINFIKPAND